MQITRRGILARIGLLVGASGILPSLTRGGVPAGPSSAHSEAAELIRDALVWDDHSGFDPVADYDLEHLEDWRQAGVNYLSIDVGYDVIDWERAIKNLGAYITWLEQRPDRFLLVRRVDDVLDEEDRPPRDHVRPGGNECAQRRLLACGAVLPAGGAPDAHRLQ